MKHYFAFLLCFSFFILVKAQTSYDKIKVLNGDSVYSNLLVEHVNYLEKINLSNSIFLKQKIFVYMLSPITDHLPRSINNKEVILFNIENFASQRKFNEFHAIWVSPMFSDGEFIKFTCTDFIISRAKDCLEQLNCGASTYFYEFNCSTRKFELKNIKRR